MAGIIMILDEKENEPILIEYDQRLEIELDTPHTVISNHVSKPISLQYSVASLTVSAEIIPKKPIEHLGAE